LRPSSQRGNAVSPVLLATQESNPTYPLIHRLLQIIPSGSSQMKHHTQLVCGLEHEFYDFPYIGNVIIPADELHHVSEGGRKTTNQMINHH
jgi:hypothetical protein